MRTSILLILPMVLLLVSACESGAKFRMINRTSYAAYASVDNSAQVIIPGGEEHVFEVDTDTQSFLTGAVKRSVKVRVFGETYSLIDNIDIPQQDSTEVELQAGKTLNAFLNPNRANIKIINESDTHIQKAEIWRHKINPFSESRTAILFDIAPGSDAWLRVKPATLSGPYIDAFYYTVAVYLEDDAENPIVFGDEENILEVDTQFVVTISPSGD